MIGSIDVEVISEKIVIRGEGVIIIEGHVLNISCKMYSTYVTVLK